MSEWWTYRPSDLLMFSPQTYYRLFELYNESIWPAQLAALAAGVAIFASILMRRNATAVSTLLAAAWLFVAFGYLYTRYATINLASPYFAYAFGAQALLLVLAGMLSRLSFSAPADWIKRVGLGLFLFALVFHPLIGMVLGRSWQSVELFGITPDPTVLATLGILLAADRMRWELLVIPLLWCAVTGATLWTMQAPDALLMPAAGLLVLALGLYRSLR